jgi:superfamily II DNA or RNA helicase
LIRVEIYNINTKLIGYPKTDSAFVLALRKILKYETEEFFGGKKMVVQRTLFNKKTGSFPTGVINLVLLFFEKNKIPYDVFDMREEFQCNDPLEFHMALRDYQEPIVNDSIKKERGVVKVATGGGKTVIAAAIIAKINRNIIFCVHTQDLLQQAHDVFSKVLKVPIGKIGCGFCDIQQINVCMVQTLMSVIGKKYIPVDEFDTYVDKKIENANAIKEFLKKTDAILIDECQHLSADTYTNLMKSIPSSRIRLGFSGTPYRDDGRDLILRAYAGKEICNINASYLIQRGYLRKPTIYIIDPLKLGKLIYTKDSYQTVYKKYIVEGERRNKTICAYAKYLFEQNRHTLILVNQIKHGKLILDMLNTMIDTRIEFLSGEVNLVQRTYLIEEMRQGRLKIIIGTTLADEGLDIPIIDGLILGGGGKSNVRILQRVGRALRLHPEKKDPIIIDFYDKIKFLSGHTAKRIKIYQSEPEFRVIKKY